MTEEMHASDASVQREVEPLVLDKLEEELNIELKRQQRVQFIDTAWVEPDGVASDNSVFVEVFAHVGQLAGAQKHKVSTDALKLIGLSELYPDAKLILAFVDEVAAKSIAGWKAALLHRQEIDIRVVELDREKLQEISDAQAKQKMVNG